MKSQLWFTVVLVSALWTSPSHAACELDDDNEFEAAICYKGKCDGLQLARQCATAFYLFSEYLHDSGMWKVTVERDENGEKITKREILWRGRPISPRNWRHLVCYALKPPWGCDAFAAVGVKTIDDPAAVDEDGVSDQINP